MRSRCTLLFAAALLGSCTEPDGPDLRFNAAWHLVSFDGTPPPAVIGTPFGRTERLLFESIHFTDSGTAYRSTRFRMDSITAGPEYGTDDHFEYQVVGPFLILGYYAYLCPDRCPPNDTAVIRGDSLVIERSYAHGGGRRVYLPALEQ